MTKQSYMTMNTSCVSSASTNKPQVVVTAVTKHTARAGGATNKMMPTPLSKASAFKQRAGSVNPSDKIETPHHTNKMIALFNRLNMPNFYKVDKITYSRGDISDLANRLTKKLDENDHLIDYERRKNDVTNREKLLL